MLLCRPVILDPADPTGNVAGSNSKGWRRLAEEAVAWLPYPCFKRWDGSLVGSWDVPVRTCHHLVPCTQIWSRHLFQEYSDKDAQAYRFSCHTDCFTVNLRDCHITPAEFLSLGLLRKDGLCSNCLLCVQAPSCTLYYTLDPHTCSSCVLYHTVAHWIIIHARPVFCIIQ